MDVILISNLFLSIINIFYVLYFYQIYILYSPIAFGRNHIIKHNLDHKNKIFVNKYIKDILANI